MKRLEVLTKNKVRNSIDQSLTKLFSNLVKFRKTNQVSISFGLDDNYVWPLLVSIYSGKEYFKKCSSIKILYDPNELSQKSRDQIYMKLKSFGVHAKFVISILPSQNNASGHISESAFLRINLPKLFKKDILWFDADVLFLNDWESVFTKFEEMSNSNDFVSARKHWPFERSENNQAIMKSGINYFNSGVLLINAKKWNSQQLDSRIQNALENYHNYGFEWADQCVLNYVIGSRYHLLEDKFNCPPVEYDAKTTKILHFAGSVKPWRYRLTIFGQLEEIENFPIDDLPNINQKSAFSIYRNLEDELILVLQLKNCT